MARPADPHALLDAVRKAHTGGRRVEQLTFHTLDELRQGVGEFFYPELMPDWTAFNVVRYRVPFMAQVAVVRGERIAWTWDGTALSTRRDGTPYAPARGIPREQHLRVNRWLFMPSEAFVDADVELSVLPDARDGRLRLGVQERGPPGEHVTLEVDPRTFLCTAVEYTARAVGIPGVLRAELLDTRDVGGARVAHRIQETVPAGGAGLPFHDVTLWDVKVQLAAP